MSTSSVMLLLNIPRRIHSEGESRVQRAEAWQQAVIAAKRSVLAKLTDQLGTSSTIAVLGGDDPLFANLTLQGDRDSLSNILPLLRRLREVENIIGEPELALPDPVAEST